MLRRKISAQGTSANYIVEDDKIQIGLNMTDLEISGTNKQQFKKIVKTKISQAAFEYLKNLQKNHSK